MIWYFSLGLVAEKELENLEKWKEQHRAKPVHLMPMRLGKCLGRGGQVVHDPVSTSPGSVFECILQVVRSLCFLEWNALKMETLKYAGIFFLISCK